MTEWRDVPGFDGRYQVSDQGEVRGQRDLMHPRPNWKGYWRIGLRRNGATESHGVAALVLSAFVGPRPAAHHAAHGDGNKDHNTLSNLRWATPAENQQDKLRHGMVVFGVRHGISKLDDDQVRAIRSRVKAGVGKRALAREYGVNDRTIRDAASGRLWSHVQ